MNAPKGPQSTGIHHIAFATKNAEETYQFYHERLGMTLARTENHRLGKGYFKHFFFDMGGGQYIAFFDIHGVGERDDFRTDINMAAGTPVWVNHVAFKVETEDAYSAIIARCKANGVRLMAEVDHDWCKSVYLADPNGLMLEFSYTYDAAGFEQDAKVAYDLLLQKGEDIPKAARKTKVNMNIGE